MTPQAYVQQKAAASGSSFYYAFLFLPPPKRSAITAFYAFCREIDDVVDEVTDPSVAQAKLGWWRTEVARLMQGAPTHPAMQALEPHLSNYRITPGHLNAIIDGCEMDLTQNRYLDYANLQTYCHLVAGVVGEVAARIFGQSQPETTAYAHAMGQAFQLTNIIRDVGEDAMRGRIYLPINELQPPRLVKGLAARLGQRKTVQHPGCRWASPPWGAVSLPLCAHKPWRWPCAARRPRFRPIRERCWQPNAPP